MKPRDIVKPSRQIYSGNICIDFTSPIAEGTMLTIQGNQSTGKTTMALNTCISYARLEPAAHIIYFTTVPAEASKFKDKFTAAVGTASLPLEAGSFDVILPKEPTSSASVFLNVNAAVRHAISLKNEGRKVLMVIEDIEGPILSGLQISRDLGFVFVGSDDRDDVELHIGVDGPLQLLRRLFQSLHHPHQKPHRLLQSTLPPRQPLLRTPQLLLQASAELRLQRSEV